MLNLLNLCLDAKADYLRTDRDGDYLIRRFGDTLYLLFEWSRGREDWRSNFNFPVRPYRDMGVTWYCHRGFLAVWKAIEPHVRGAVMDSTVRRVYVVGYSHGAAIATLAHEYVWFHRPDLRDRLEGYGFGCPRCYWGFRVRQSLRERWATFYPVRNGGDIVTHLPPCLFGFVHVNRVRHIGDKMPHKHTRIPMVNAHYACGYQHSLGQRENYFEDT
jgi:hypothetical protein